MPKNGLESLKKLTKNLCKNEERRSQSRQKYIEELEQENHRLRERLKEFEQKKPENE